MMGICKIGDNMGDSSVGYMVQFLPDRRQPTENVYFTLIAIFLCYSYMSESLLIHPK